MGKKTGLKIEVNAEAKLKAERVTDGDGEKDARGKVEEAARSLAQAKEQRRAFDEEFRKPQKSRDTVAQRLARCFG